jgi:hypothetical protein
MDHPAVRDLLPLHPKKPSNINRKANPKLSGNIPGDDLSALFDHVMELRTRSGPESTGRGRPLRDQFHLAILGQFNLNKNRLLKVLLGESILPTSVISLTAFPIFHRQGPELCARFFPLLFMDGGRGMICSHRNFRGNKKGQRSLRGGGSRD